MMRLCLLLILSDLLSLGSFRLQTTKFPSLATIRLTLSDRQIVDATVLDNTVLEERDRVTKDETQSVDTKTLIAPIYKTQKVATPPDQLPQSVEEGTKELKVLPYFVLRCLRRMKRI